MKQLTSVLWLSFLFLVFAGVFLYSGFYPVGADRPHFAATHWILETARERSVARASASISVPPLEDPELLLMGAADYHEMCSSCHLRPQLQQTDLSLGLYPTPPNLTQSERWQKATADPMQMEREARRQFWIIKHGIKASGMPAWGITHDDQRIWAMVAFLQKLPELSKEEYQILSAR